MSAKQLIQIASQKGIAIARFKSGIYQYWKGGQAPTNFVGSWSEFTKFIVAQ